MVLGLAVAEALAHNQHLVRVGGVQNAWLEWPLKRILMMLDFW